MKFPVPRVILRNLPGWTTMQRRPGGHAMALPPQLPIAIAGGIGAMLGNLLLLRPTWPETAGDWVGIGMLGVATAAGIYLALRVLFRRSSS
jgi:hypothetical protein